MDAAKRYGRWCADRRWRHLGQDSRFLRPVGEDAVLVSLPPQPGGVAKRSEDGRVIRVGIAGGRWV
jgi:hypothetical protein